LDPGPRDFEEGVIVLKLGNNGVDGVFGVYSVSGVRLLLFLGPRVVGVINEVALPNTALGRHIDVCVLGDASHALVKTVVAELRGRLGEVLLNLSEAILDVLDFGGHVSPRDFEAHDKEDGGFLDAEGGADDYEYHALQAHLVVEHDQHWDDDKHRVQVPQNDKDLEGLSIVNEDLFQLCLADVFCGKRKQKSAAQDHAHGYSSQLLGAGFAFI